MHLRYRLLNVVSIEGSPFSGNPLCVFEDASGLSTEQMQAWARQFNLSETAFVTAVRPDAREADARIFTASYEMPFAGHPTLGTAHVVADLMAGPDAGPGGPAEGGSGSSTGSGTVTIDEVGLSLPAGVIPVTRADHGWRLRANRASHRTFAVPDDQLASTLGLPTDAIVPDAAEWVDVGVEQLIVQLADADAVRACRPDVGLMHEHLRSPGRPPHVYVWAWTGASTAEARLFAVSGSALDEDPATGSACSNLGGWLANHGRRGLTVTVSQGMAVERPSRLVLTIDDDGSVDVSGRVTEVGHGVVGRS